MVYMFSPDGWEVGCIFWSPDHNDAHFELQGPPVHSLPPGNPCSPLTASPLSLVPLGSHSWIPTGKVAWKRMSGKKEREIVRHEGGRKRKGKDGEERERNRCIHVYRVSAHSRAQVIFVEWMKDERKEKEKVGSMGSASKEQGGTSPFPLHPLLQGCWTAPPGWQLPGWFPPIYLTTASGTFPKSHAWANAIVAPGSVEIKFCCVFLSISFYLLFSTWTLHVVLNLRTPWRSFTYRLLPHLSLSF